MVVILLIVVVLLAILVAGLIYSNFELKQQLELVDKEQHIQNEDIINLMKNHIKHQDHIKQHQEMLLQHIEILKYLIEQDPKLNRNFMLMGKPGEAQFAYL